MARELFLLITAAGALAMAYVAGAIQPVFVNDQTGIVWLIGGLGVVTTALATKRRGFLRFVAGKGVPTMLGLTGTVLGLTFALRGIDGQPGPEELAAAFTALNTTVVGFITQLYLMVVREVTR